MPRPEKVRLGEILLQQGLLTAEQLQQALDEQRKSGRKLGRVFVEKGFVSEDQISTALARQLQVPFVNLKHFTLKPEIAVRQNLIALVTVLPDQHKRLLTANPEHEPRPAKIAVGHEQILGLNPRQDLRQQGAFLRVGILTQHDVGDQAQARFIRVYWK